MLICAITLTKYFFIEHPNADDMVVSYIYVSVEYERYFLHASKPVYTASITFSES
jgi:hypothetical protein